MANIIDKIKDKCEEVDPTIDWFEVFYSSYDEPDLSEEEIMENVKKLLEGYGNINIRKSK